MFYGGINPKSNHSLTYLNTNNQMKTTRNQISYPKKTKKTVTFNNKIDIVNVESFKEFNKIDDDEINVDYFQRYNYPIGHNSGSKNNKKRDCDCTCDIY